MSEKNSAPPIPTEVVAWLRRIRPEKLPTLDMSDREVWAHVGEQQIIRILEREWERQNNPR